jgi:hypothetical protein
MPTENAEVLLPSAQPLLIQSRRGCADGLHVISLKRQQYLCAVYLNTNNFLLCYYRKFQVVILTFIAKISYKFILWLLKFAGVYSFRRTT